MIEAPLPDNEQERLRELEDLDILDTLEEQAYDDLTEIAAQICDVPIALVSLVDAGRQWFKSHHGLDARETPRALAFCAHAILDDQLFIVEDSTKDPRFADNPLATGVPHVKFYAGAPLVISKNVRLGTLCVIDDHPRSLSQQQKSALQALARQVVSQLELRRSLKALRALDTAKDEFISMVSHELRTPLTSIKGSLALLNSEADTLPPKLERMADIASRNTERVLTIVNDILQLSKLEAGKLELNLDDVDVITLLHEAAELNEAYCRECGNHIELELTDSDQRLVVTGDKQRLLQVMSNFLSNAAKFSPAGSPVKLSCSVADGRVTIKVTNYGPGISVESQKYLFQKFTQLGRQGNQKLPGTGLGLNISKHLLQIHRSDIGCESVPDKFTSFFFSLPLVTAA